MTTTIIVINLHSGYSQKHYSGIADIGKLLQKNYKELYYMYKNAQKIKHTQLKT